MNPMMGIECGAADAAPPVKSETARPLCPPITMQYLNLFGSYLAPERMSSTKSVLWYYFMSASFIGYVLFFLVFGTLDFILFYRDYFWVLYLTMLIKCAILRRSVFEIRNRIINEEFGDILMETEGVAGRALRYFVYAVAGNTVVILLYNIVWMVSYPSVINAFVSLMFILGTVVFTGYMSTIILFCLADVRFALKQLNSCTALAREGRLTPAVYSQTQKQIDLIVKKSFWIDGALFLFIILNTVSAIVLLLTYENFTESYTVLQVIVFIIYVLVVMWAVDAVFLLFIVPEIAEVNESFSELHLVLAESKHSDSNSEMARYDTLHLVVARPVRYLIAGFHLTRGNVKTRIIGVVLTMFFFIARLIILLVLEHH